MRKAQITLNILAASILLSTIMFVEITDITFSPFLSKCMLTAIMVLIEIAILLGILQRHRNHLPIHAHTGAFLGMFLCMIGAWLGV